MGKLTNDGALAVLNFLTGRDTDPHTAGTQARGTYILLTSTSTASVSGAPSSDPDQATVAQWTAKEQGASVLGAGYTTRCRVDDATASISYTGGVGAKVGELTAPQADFTCTASASGNVVGFALVTGGGAGASGVGGTPSSVWAYADFDGGGVSVSSGQTFRIAANSVKFRTA